MKLTKALLLAWFLATTPIQVTKAQDTTKQQVEIALNTGKPDEVKKILGDMSGIDIKKIDEALKNFNEALTRLERNRHFRSYDINKSLLFSLMVKESFLDNSRVSISGAKGYFQMKSLALQDAKTFIKDKLKIKTKEYSLDDPVESIILWIAYFLTTNERIETLSEKLQIESSQADILTLLAYNLWITDTGKLVTIYYDETKKESFQWDEFTIWLVQKMWFQWKNSLISENIYKIQYRDWFEGKDISKNDEPLSFSSTFFLKKSKIQEFINYVEKIQWIMTKKEWISWEIKETPSSQQIVPSRESKEAFQREWEQIYAQIITGEDEVTFLKRFWFSWPLALGSFQDINSQAFENRTLMPQKISMKEGVKYQIPVFATIVLQWDGWNSILVRKGIPLKFKEKVIQFNKLYNPDIEKNGLKLWGVIMIPFWKTGFYSDGQTDEVPKEVKPNVVPPKATPPLPVTPSKRIDSKEQVWWKFDFDNWIQSIEVIGNSLKWKVFVLDPGHGGPDLWSHPIAKDKDGNPIKDANSAIRVVDDEKWKTNFVKPGMWSGYLHVYESLATLDVAYRLAKQIKENGWEVYITRYSQKTGIIQDSNSTTPQVSDDIFSDTKIPWEYTPWNQNFRLRRWTQIANEVLKKVGARGIKEENVFFLSIHADFDTRGPIDNPITFRYYNGSSWVSEGGKKFAESLAGKEFRMKKTEAVWQGLYIVNPDFNNISQSVLVELGNMRNAWVSYLLRQFEGRQRYADILFQSISEAVQKK